MKNLTAMPAAATRCPRSDPGTVIASAAASSPASTVVTSKALNHSPSWQIRTYQRSTRPLLHSLKQTLAGAPTQTGSFLHTSDVRDPSLSDCGNYTRAAALFVIPRNSYILSRVSLRTSPQGSPLSRISLSLATLRLMTIVTCLVLRRSHQTTTRVGTFVAGGGNSARGLRLSCRGHSYLSPALHFGTRRYNNCFARSWPPFLSLPIPRGSRYSGLSRSTPLFSVQACNIQLDFAGNAPVRDIMSEVTEWHTLCPPEGRLVYE